MLKLFKFHNAAWLVLASALPLRAAYDPQVGEPHPDFVLNNIHDGQPVALSDFRGKKVLLLHFASW